MSNSADSRFCMGSSCVRIFFISQAFGKGFYPMSTFWWRMWTPKHNLSAIFFWVKFLLITRSVLPTRVGQKPLPSASKSFFWSIWVGFQNSTFSLTYLCCNEDLKVTVLAPRFNRRFETSDTCRWVLSIAWTLSKKKLDHEFSHETSKPGFGFHKNLKGTKIFHHFTHFVSIGLGCLRFWRFDCCRKSVYVDIHVGFMGVQKYNLSVGNFPPHIFAIFDDPT